MSSETDSAYRTSDETIIAAYHAYIAACNEVREKRDLLSLSEGRHLYVNRLGFSRGTKVVGFERFNSDKDYDLLADGALIVSKHTGPHRGIVVPNMRRKSGRKYADHLREYDTPGLDIPGMPPFMACGLSMDGISVHVPALWVWEDVLYAFWTHPEVEVGEQWETIPLSTYYLAREQHDAVEAVKVSGNRGSESGSN